MEPNELTKTIGAIVAENYHTADVFLKYKIDFCCGGGQTLSEICENNPLISKQLQEELTAASANFSSPRENFKEWDLAFLSDYIIQKHHHYIRHSTPIISQLLDKIVEVHSETHPELREIREIFVELSEELDSHLQKEEMILFPYLKNLAGAEKYNLENPHVCVKTIQKPIKVMETEHEGVGILLKLIRDLTQNYTLPSEACATYQLTFAKLQAFEKDLFHHIHLENNILFPKALRAERKLMEYLNNC